MFQEEKARDGLMLHELGHVLGFRHEHAHTGCTPEGSGGTELIGDHVDYDSIMFYVQCPGGRGTWRGSLSEGDKVCARCVYLGEGYCESFAGQAPPQPDNQNQRNDQGECKVLKGCETGSTSHGDPECFILASSRGWVELTSDDRIDVDLYLTSSSGNLGCVSESYGSEEWCPADAGPVALVHAYKSSGRYRVCLVDD